MPDHEKRIEEANDDQVYLYASDPHRIAAARAQAARTRRDPDYPTGAVDDSANGTRNATWAAILGAAVLCVLAILAAVAYLRAAP